jgi:DNA (cytosine-5)-methyltransferase 1
MTLIDLFSGCGGMSWGLRKKGFQVIAGLDNSERALETFRLNHPEAITVCADISQYEPSRLRNMVGLKPESLDCLIGGPPCQGFSRNVPAAYRFLDDPRNQLYRRFIDYVAEFLPKTLLIENVAEIFNAYGGHVREEIVSKLNALGYEVIVRVLYAPDYGVPQRRRRCIFFASRIGVAPKFPEATFGVISNELLFGMGYRSAWSAISDLPSLRNGEGVSPSEYIDDPLNEFQQEMRHDAHLLYDHVARRLTSIQFERMKSLQPGEGLKNLPSKIRPKSGYSGAYGRLDFEMIAPTVTRWVFHPGSGRYGHPKDYRLITIREAARIQSFSDDFRFTGTYIEKAAQIGNAVPPLLIGAFADAIKKCCGGEKATIRRIRKHSLVAA